MGKRILVICYKRPFPLHSGTEVSTYQYINVLSEYFPVDVLYLSDKNVCKDKLDSICNNIYIFQEKKIIKYIRMIKNCLVYDMPLQTGQMYSGKVAKWIKMHYSDYELILCIHIKMAPYIMDLALSDTVSKEKLFFYGADSISLQCHNAYRVNRGWKKAAYFFEYKKMISYEKKVYEAIDNTILVSQRDKQFILEKVRAECNPHIIYNYAVDLGYKENVEKDECSVCFMGKMNYNPNIAAVLYFANCIYPKVKSVYSNFVFHIIGGDATKKIEDLNKIDGIKVHGFVDNAAEYLQRATIVIAPMKSGSGLQNKIIQAMYLGCMVITSEIGADGLVDLQGDEIVVYRNDSEFVNQLNYFLSAKNAQRREMIGKNARAYIEHHYSYDVVKKRIVEVLLGEEYEHI